MKGPWEMFQKMVVFVQPKVLEHAKVTKSTEAELELWHVINTSKVREKVRETLTRKIGKMIRGCSNISAPHSGPDADSVPFFKGARVRNVMQTLMLVIFF